MKEPKIECISSEENLPSIQHPDTFEAAEIANVPQIIVRTMPELVNVPLSIGNRKSLRKKSRCTRFGTPDRKISNTKKTSNVPPKLKTPSKVTNKKQLKTLSIAPALKNIAKKCFICKNKFSDALALQNHVESVHNLSIPRITTQLIPATTNNSQTNTLVPNLIMSSPTFNVSTPISVTPTTMSRSIIISPPSSFIDSLETPSLGITPSSQIMSPSTPILTMQTQQNKVKFRRILPKD